MITSLSCFETSILWRIAFLFACLLWIHAFWGLYVFCKNLLKFEYFEVVWVFKIVLLQKSEKYNTFVVLGKWQRRYIWVHFFYFQNSDFLTGGCSGVVAELSRSCRGVVAECSRKDVVHKSSTHENKTNN